MRHILLATLVLSGGITTEACSRAAADKPTAAFTDQVRSLDSQVITAEEARDLGSMLARDVRARLLAANQRHAQAFDDVKTRADWERFRAVRMEALRKALGPYP